MMIYIVEDDANIRELVVYTLNNLVMPTKGFKDGKEFESAMEDETPDLIIFDLMLPGKDGLTLLKELKQQKQLNHIPVLILSAKGNEYDKVQGLNTGADDYLAKPFGAMELVARVNALLRRSQLGSNKVNNKKDIITFGPLIYKQQSREFLLHNQPLVLTHKEFMLLELFIENPKIALSRDQLLNQIWGYDYDGESRTVDVHVASLRHKLEDYGKSIETIRSYGYRFRPDE